MHQPHRAEEGLPSRLAHDEPGNYLMDSNSTWDSRTGSGHSFILPPTGSKVPNPAVRQMLVTVWFVDRKGERFGTKLLTFFAKTDLQIRQTTGRPVMMSGSPQETDHSVR